jgi:PTS system nitrogen regulatory IIA component
MKLRDILKKEAIVDDLKSDDKKGILNELSDAAIRVIPELNKAQVLGVLLNREKLGSTGIGNGIAIPHGKIGALNNIFAIFGRSHAGVDFESHDQKPTHLFFVLLAPEAAIGSHLQALARLSRLLKENHMRERLINCNANELFDILLAEDDKL